MAAWDALARAAHLPLAELLGGTVGDVPAYNSNGLWLSAIDGAGRGGGGTGVRRRLPGRSSCASAGTASPTTCRRSAKCARPRRGRPPDGRLQPGSHPGRCPCGAVTPSTSKASTGSRSRPPTTTSTGYAQLTRELRDAGAARRELLRAARAVARPRARRRRLRDARPDAHRGCLGVVALGADRRCQGHRGLDAPAPEVAAHLMRVTETAHWLEWQDWANPILKSRSRFATAASSFRIGRAAASNGTRPRSSGWRSTREGGQAAHDTGACSRPRQGRIPTMTHQVSVAATGRALHRALVRSAVAAGLVLASSATAAQGVVTLYGGARGAASSSTRTPATRRSSSTAAPPGH